MASSDIEKGKGDELCSWIPVEGRTKQEWKNTFVAEVLRSDSPMLDSFCIFRVPEVLRRQKKVAYQPDIVSIGPFHRGGEEFQRLENVKKWYLKCFLSHTQIELDSLIEHITESETRARYCYAEPLDLDQNDFVEMLILDGCFLIELFRKAALDPKDEENQNDPIFNVPCMLEFLYHDLLLLENQLPWFVLEFFYRRLIENENTINPPLSQVVIDFFNNSVADPCIFNYDHYSGSSPEILHVLDLIRSALVQEQKQPSRHLNRSSKIDRTATPHLPQSIPSAATLLDAGVIFKKGKPGCILNITFNNGVFTIPPLAIDERTGPLFRNLIAYEQCYHRCQHKITSYAVLMDNLIDTRKDVDLLCDKGILSNWLSAEDASKSFRELYKDTTVIGYDYGWLSDYVDKYHKALWSRWREKVKRDYFDQPWSVINVYNLVFIWVLTLVQTIYSIQSYHDSHLPKKNDSH